MNKYLDTRLVGSVDFHILRTLKYNLDNSTCQEQWLPWVSEKTKTFTLKNVKQLR